MNIAAWGSSFVRSVMKYFKGDEAEEPQSTENPSAEAEEPQSEENLSAEAEEPQSEENPSAEAEEPQSEENPSAEAEEPQSEENPSAEAEEPESEENPSAEAEEPQSEGNPSAEAEEPQSEENPSAEAKESQSEENSPPASSSNISLLSRQLSSLSRKETAILYEEEEHVKPEIRNPNTPLRIPTGIHDLIGDFSKAYLLPIVSGMHQDLPSISPTTMTTVLNREYNCEFLIIDCRYPYEYEGGHITGAKNLYTKSAVAKNLFPTDVTLYRETSRTMLIFHCEFSSKRAPDMYRFVRNKDRELNLDCYPSLCYPEMYLLEGGYKLFYTNYKEHCYPQGYKTMKDTRNVQDLMHFTAKCKSGGSDNRKCDEQRSRRRARMRLNF